MRCEYVLLGLCTVSLILCHCGGHNMIITENLLGIILFMDILSFVNVPFSACTTVERRLVALTIQVPSEDAATYHAAVLPERFVDSHKPPPMFLRVRTGPFQRLNKLRDQGQLWHKRV